MRNRHYFQGGKMKYGNTKYQIDGMLFDSKKEANYWYELKMLEKAGQICNIQRQKPFELIPTRYYNGVCVRGCKYIADFYFYDNIKKSWIAVDVKGFPTPEYIIKKKIFLEKYVLNGDLIFYENGNNPIFYQKSKKIDR